MRPHILRRMKEHVEKSIPKKEETIIDVELTTLQKKYYRALYERNRAFLTRGLENKNAGPVLLNLEMELRKCCNHPFLVKGVEIQEAHGGHDDPLRIMIESSGKLVLLNKLLEKLKAEGHKVLLFSQMTRMLDILEQFSRTRGYVYERIDGSVRGNARQAAIDRFCDPDAGRFIFLLSTRAGGVGINLTAADTVVIFDSDWNPQNDIQAQARAHRIGQTQEVKVYRLLMRNTYEAAMFARASRKLGLEQAVLGRASGRGAPTKEEVEMLLRHGAYGPLVDEDDEDAAARTFMESDIDQLLARGSRVVTVDTLVPEEDGDDDDEGAAGGAAAAEGRGAAAGGGGGGGRVAPGVMNFSKTTFASDASDTRIAVDDPQFWAKVLGADSRDTMLHRLENGDATATPEAKESFLREVEVLVEEVVEERLDGVSKPRYFDEIMNVLVEIKSMTSKFTDAERATAATWLEEVCLCVCSRAPRVRSCSALVTRAGGAAQAAAQDDPGATHARRRFRARGAQGGEGRGEGATRAGAARALGGEGATARCYAAREGGGEGAARRRGGREGRGEGGGTPSAGSGARCEGCRGRRGPRGLARASRARPRRAAAAAAEEAEEVAHGVRGATARAREAVQVAVETRGGETGRHDRAAREPRRVRAECASVRLLPHRGRPRAVHRPLPARLPLLLHRHGRRGGGGAEGAHGGLGVPRLHVRRAALLPVQCRGARGRPVDGPRVFAQTVDGQESARGGGGGPGDRGGCGCGRRGLQRVKVPRLRLRCTRAVLGSGRIRVRRSGGGLRLRRHAHGGLRGLARGAA